ncbi:hypothetical protein LX64_05164 [Chitinophaga skermanii]|uniref:Conjugal transfer protein TraI n=1 Tax=Chitinophaga skermanii TaxID=331697 RepID=A0A327PYA1_9BACT|nr:hypothetical protein [Chitinophaga skermanii]RAI97019.1 hypothetical protein LX64_05164 [Chitinophaga skermanii]
MKKLIFFLILLTSIALTSRGQGGVVSAPVLESIETANKATLLKQLAEGIKQTGVLSDVYSKLKQSVELYYKVSNALKTADVVTNAIDKQITLVNTCSAALKDIQRVKGASTTSIQRVRRNIATVVDSYKSNIDMLRQLITEDGLRMDDGARLQLVMEIDDKTAEATRKVRSYQSNFEAAAAAKLILKQ